MLQILSFLCLVSAAMTPAVHAGSGVAVDPGTQATQFAGLEAFYLRAGVSADALAAAGCTAQQTSVALHGSVATSNEQSQALVLVDRNIRQLEVQLNEQIKALREDGSSPEIIEQIEGTKSDLAEARTSQSSCLNLIFEAFNALLPGPAADRLSAIRSNQEWSLPVHFLVLEQTKPEWVQLKAAYQNDVISAEIDLSPDPELQLVLSAALLNPAVSAARVQHETRISAVASTWQSFFTDQ